MKPLYREMASVDEVNAAFDVERSVPDPAVHGAWFERESVGARAEFAARARLDVPYGPTVDETLDLFPSAAPGPAPIVVYLHGGFWRRQTAKPFSFVARGVAGLGGVTAVVRYGLCPNVRMREIVRQTRAAIAWAHRHAAEFGGDASRLYVVGHSAGAQLAAMAALTDWAGDYALPPDVVRGCLCVSGIYDLRPLRYTLVQPWLQLDADETHDLSPLLLDLPARAPAMLFSYGTDDPPEFRRQTDEFRAAWARRGLVERLFVQVGKNHFTAVTDLKEPAAPLTTELARLIHEA